MSYINDYNQKYIILCLIMIKLIMNLLITTNLIIPSIHLSI